MTLWGAVIPRHVATGARDGSSGKPQRPRRSTPQQGPTDHRPRLRLPRRHAALALVAPLPLTCCPITLQAPYSFTYINSKEEHSVYVEFWGIHLTGVSI